MPITMTQHAPGMPPHAYDEIMVGAGEPLRRSPGFVSTSRTRAATASP